MDNITYITTDPYSFETDSYRCCFGVIHIYSMRDYHRKGWRRRDIWQNLISTLISVSFFGVICLVSSLVCVFPVHIVLPVGSFSQCSYLETSWNFHHLFFWGGLNVIFQNILLLNFTLVYLKQLWWLYLLAVFWTKHWLVLAL